MIRLKSPREIGLMREAGRLVAKALSLVEAAIRPGVTTRQLDEIVDRLFAEHSATPLFKGYPGKKPFPAATCISVNEQVVHGIPGERVLKEGDIVSIDTGCRLAGWCGDSAWTYAVGEVDAVKTRLLNVGEETLMAAIASIPAARRWSDVSLVMQRIVQRAKYSLVLDFVGHGIGRELHEDPQVPCVLPKSGSPLDFEIRPGLVLAIEPMINAGTAAVKILKDHWTVVTADGLPSVHFEHTVAITENGVEVLTRL